MKLKSCPFCGSEADLSEFSKDAWAIICSNEKCLLFNIDIWFDTKEQAITAWNTRGKVSEEKIRDLLEDKFGLAEGVEFDVNDETRNVYFIDLAQAIKEAINEGGVIADGTQGMRRG